MQWIPLQLTSQTHEAPPLLVLGPSHLLTQPTLALLSSNRAPASILLAVHDLAQRWRRQGPLVMSGFQSPVENEALTVLLRGPWPVAIWLGRGPLQRIPAAYEQPLAQSRLLLIAPFGEHVRRVTAETSLVRNCLLAQCADDVLIAHAEPGSKTEQLARALIGEGKRVQALEHEANANLRALGAYPHGFRAQSGHG